MIYKIHEQDSETLLEMPETGMGYQIVQANQYQRSVSRKFVVYNTNLAVELDSDFDYYKRKIINEGYSASLNDATELMLETSTIKMLSRPKNTEDRTMIEAVLILKRLYNNRQSGGEGATDSPKENASGYETFVRISAFENDKRIDFEKKKLKSGSFTTTVKDYTECVVSNDDPVDRYALPNDDKIEWSFYLKPVREDVLQRGIVQPAFKHTGGGVEAFFEKGTSVGTFIKKMRYGKGM